MVKNGVFVKSENTPRERATRRWHRALRRTSVVV